MQTYNSDTAAIANDVSTHLKRDTSIKIILVVGDCSSRDTFVLNMQQRLGRRITVHRVAADNVDLSGVSSNLKSKKPILLPIHANQIDSYAALMKPFLLIAFAPDRETLQESASSVEVFDALNITRDQYPMLVYSYYVRL